MPPEPTTESSSDVMARLTKFIYNYQGKELDRYGVQLIGIVWGLDVEWEGVGSRCAF